MKGNEHIALYRKLRPTTFNDVVGQEHIVTILKNQIVKNLLSHAYLFTGSRGTGKTSVAKIFAKSINCESPKEDGSPCMACQSCKDMANNTSMNIIEMDAASNNSVDNIRDINENVKYPPTNGKYKIFIIDEVHMLSTAAFNALLKTLEEPPKYVIFILATTDPQKIPDTILSRCMRFNFRRISNENISKTLISAMNKEGVKLEDKAAHYIATLADGGLRDAFSLLESCTAYLQGQEISYEKVLDVLDSVDLNIVFKTVDAMIQKNPEAIFNNVKEVYNQGRNLNQFISDLIYHMNNLLIAKTVKEVEHLIDKDQEYLSRLKQQAQQIEISHISYCIKEISLLQLELKTSNNPIILIQSYLLKLTQYEVEPSTERLLEEIKNLNSKIENYDKILDQLISDKVQTLIKDFNQNHLMIHSNNISQDQADEQQSQEEISATQEVAEEVSQEESQDIEAIQPNVLQWENVLNHLNAMNKAIFLQTTSVCIENGIITLTFNETMKPLVENSLVKLIKALELEKCQKDLSEYHLVIHYKSH